MAKSKTHLKVRLVISVVLLIVAIWLLLMHRNSVTGSIRVVKTASGSWLTMAIGLYIFTFLVAAAIYGQLALRRLRYLQTVLVEIAAAAVNRILPAGLGGLGLHGAYLYKQKHTVAEATAVVSVNNLLGMVAHLLLLVCVFIWRPEVFVQLLHMQPAAINWWWLVAGVVILAALLLITRARRRLILFIHNLFRSLYHLRIQQLLSALVLAILLTITYTEILWCSALALGVTLNILQIFIVFSLSMLTSSVTPTPGGLVGAEAGLFAGFVGYGVPSATAGAVVVVFRLVTYWLPLLPGLVALWVARKRSIL